MLAAVFVSVVLALTVPSTQGFNFEWGRCPDPPLASGFNETKWMNGTWFQTARFGFLFANDVSCITASYRPAAVQGNRYVARAKRAVMAMAARDVNDEVGQDGTVRLVVDGIRDDEPIEQVDFLYLVPGEPGEYTAYHDDYRSLPLGYRIILWDDHPDNGYFVHFSCIDLFFFNFQNMAIYQRTPRMAQREGIKAILRSPGYDIDTEELENVRQNCYPA